MIRAAIIGCGKIADAHAAQIMRVTNSELVGACDREPLMAEQLCERFGVKGSFSEVSELLSKARPDVVHITTPPASHFELASICLESGCHVYVEKPFTLHAAEARELIALAQRKGLKLTVGHDDQFSHVARRMRELIQHGYLGGVPVHMESIYCYDLSAPGYARALLGDKQHWVRKLPGKLLHNIISHGIARVAEFLLSESPHVIAHGFVSAQLRELGEQEIIDELRVIISDAARTTAFFTFSTQMRPSLHQFRIYGHTNGLALDNDQEILLKLQGTRFPSYAEKFLPPLLFAKQHCGSFARNLQLFLARDFHMKSGMKFLIESFYQSITKDLPPPIPYREIYLTSWIMESIFGQLASSIATPRLESINQRSIEE